MRKTTFTKYQRYDINSPYNGLHAQQAKVEAMRYEPDQIKTNMHHLDRNTHHEDCSYNLMSLLKIPLRFQLT